MTTDNQTIDNLETTKDNDAIGLLIQQEYLKSLGDKFHDFQAVRELKQYCQKIFSDIEIQSAMNATGYAEIDGFPITKDEDHSQILKAILNVQQLWFDSILNSLKQSILDRESHDQRIYFELSDLEAKQSSELVTLQTNQSSKLATSQANQSSEVKALQQKIYAIDDDIRSKHIKLEEYQTAISTEIAFLAGGFVIGLIGGIQGAIGLTIAVFIVRCGILSLFF